MGLVDYDSSSSDENDEGRRMVQSKQPSHPPAAVVTSTSTLNNTAAKSKKFAKRGERRQQQTTNFFLPPKMQEALLTGNMLSDSEDSDDDDGAKIRMKQRNGEKGLLDILPAPSSGTSKGGGGSLGAAAAKMVASQINSNRTKNSNNNILDNTTTIRIEREDEEEDEEGQEEDHYMISCIQQEIGLIGKAKKPHLKSQQVTSVGDTSVNCKQLSSKTHDSIAPMLTTTQVCHHRPTTIPWSSHTVKVNAATEEFPQPTVRSQIPTLHSAQTTWQQPVPAYYNQGHGPEDNSSNTQGNNSQGGSSRRGNKRNLERMLASGNLQALEQQQPGTNVQVTTLQGHDPSNFDVAVALDSRRNPGEAKAEGTKLQRRKHQINTLAAQAKAMEQELLDNAGRGKLTKAQTHAKYGW